MANWADDPWSDEYERDLEHIRRQSRTNAVVGLVLVLAVVAVVAGLVIAVRTVFSGDICLVECGV